MNNHIDMKYKDLSYRAENMGQQFLHLPHFKNLSISKNQSHSISSPVALFHVWQVRYFSSPQWFDFARKQSRSKIHSLYWTHMHAQRSEWKLASPLWILLFIAHDWKAGMCPSAYWSMAYSHIPTHLDQDFVSLYLLIPH